MMDPRINYGLPDKPLSELPVFLRLARAFPAEANLTQTETAEFRETVRLLVEDALSGLPAALIEAQKDGGEQAFRAVEARAVAELRASLGPLMETMRKVTAARGQHVTVQ